MKLLRLFGKAVGYGSVLYCVTEYGVEFVMVSSNSAWHGGRVGRLMRIIGRISKSHQSAKLLHSGKDPDSFRGRVPFS